MSIFLDVGQGECAIIVADGDAMIIDGGSSWASQIVYSHLRNKLHLQNVKIMVATHPHEDHIGGLSGALNAVPVDLILSPVLEYDSKEFSELTEYAYLQGSVMDVPFPGDVFSLGNATVTIVECWTDAWSVNDMSIVLRVDYGKRSFLFTGDAEEYLEYMLVDSGQDLSADVLKVGHHGSSSSSTMEFLDEISPSYAVISCGKENIYGHPRQSTLDKLVAAGAEIFRTDLHGDILFHSDGESLTYITEKVPEDIEQVYIAPKASFSFEIPEECFIGNKSTKKFHNPNCFFALNMSESNIIVFENYWEAKDAGFTECKSCSPRPPKRRVIYTLDMQPIE